MGASATFSMRQLVILWYAGMVLFSYGVFLRGTLASGEVPHFHECMIWWLLVVWTFFVTPPLLLGTASSLTSSVDGAGMRRPKARESLAVLKPLLVFTVSIAPAVVVGLELLRFFQGAGYDDDAFMLEGIFLMAVHLHPCLFPPVAQPLILVGNAALSSGLYLFFRRRRWTHSEAACLCLFITCVLLLPARFFAVALEFNLLANAFLGPIVIERVALPSLLLWRAFR